MPLRFCRCGMGSVSPGEHGGQEASVRAGNRLAVCIATFRRPEGLNRLLDAFQRLSFTKGPEPQVAIVVADNDPESSAASNVRGIQSGYRWPLHYRVEPRRGISYARNAAVKLALETGAEWIAFIDDDEIPEPEWLDELLHAQRQYAADVVAGPVLPEYEDGTPVWVMKGHFFDRPRLSTGTALSSTRTGNLLALANCFDGNLHFDPDFGQSGGEDTLFTLQLVREGKKIVWADRAVVKEIVSLKRANARYVLYGAYSGGSNWARMERLLYPRFRTRAARLAKGALHILAGAFSVLPALSLGRHAAVRSASQICLGAGQIIGALGRSSRKYGEQS